MQRAGVPCANSLSGTDAATVTRQSPATQRYEVFCRSLRMKVNKDVVAVLQRADADGMDSRISVDFSSTFLGTNGALPIIDIVAHAVSLAAISFAGTGLGDLACGALCRALCVHPSLRQLDLSNNNITAAALCDLRLLCSATGCSVNVAGNEGIPRAAAVRLAETSGNANSARKHSGVPQQLGLHHAPPASTSKLHREALLFRRRTQQQQAFAQQRALRRIVPDADGWMSIGVFASAPYTTFGAEIEQLQLHVVPALNRRLRAFKVQLCFTALQQPSIVHARGVGAVADEDARKCMADDAAAAANARVRRELIQRHCDIMLCFTPGGPSVCGFEETAIDFKARTSLGVGATLAFGYERQLDSVPECLRMHFEAPLPGALAPFQREQRKKLVKEFRAIAECNRESYSGDFLGLTPIGQPVTSVPESLMRTISTDLFHAALWYRSRVPSSQPVFAPLDEVDLAALRGTELQRSMVPDVVERVRECSASADRRLVCVEGPAGSGKSAHLKKTLQELQKNTTTCTVVMHSVLGGDCRLDSVLCSVTRKLGIPGAMRGWYETPQACMEGFLDDLASWTPPASASAVTVLIDDGDQVAGGTGIQAFSTIDQRRLRTADGKPVVIVYSSTVPSYTSSIPSRQFVEGIRLPPLSEMDAAALFLQRLRDINVVRGPRSEEAANDAARLIVLEKSHGRRPLYLMVASWAVQHFSEETTMVSIAQGLPPTCPELIAAVLAPSLLPPRVNDVLSAVGALGQLDTQLLMLVLGRARDPWDPRGGCTESRNRWGTLTTTTLAPHAGLDMATVRVLLPGLLNEAENTSAVRSSVSFDSCTIVSHFSEAHHEDSTFTRRLISEKHAVVTRLAYVRNHRFNSIALSMLPGATLFRWASLDIVANYLLQHQEQDLRRQWVAAQETGLDATQPDAPFTAITRVLQRHWPTVTERPTSIFQLLADETPGCCARFDVTEWPSAAPFAKLQQQGFSSQDDRPRHFAVQSVFAAAAGWDPSSGLPGDACELPSPPLQLVPTAIAMLMFFGPDQRDTTIREQVSRGKRAAKHIQYSLVRPGTLSAVAPPTFAAAEATCASIEVHHDALIASVEIVESVNKDECRVAASLFQVPQVTVVSLFQTVTGQLSFVRVAQLLLDSLPALVAMSGDASAEGSVVGVSSPSVAVANNAVLLVWPSDPRGADTVVNTRMPLKPVEFSGAVAAIEHAAYSPGGAKIVAVDTTGTVTVWGSLESPCPALHLASSISEGIISRVLFPLPDEVMFICDRNVTFWNCTTSQVRTAIEKPTPVPPSGFWLDDLLWEEPGDGDGPSLPRPRMALTFVDHTSQIIVTYNELPDAPGEFGAAVETRFAVSTAAEADTHVVAVAGAPLIWNRHANTVHFGLEPGSPVLSVAAGPNEETGASENGNFTAPGSPVPLTAVASATHAATGQRYTVVAARRRHRDPAAGAGSGRVSESIVVAAAILEEGTLCPPMQADVTHPL